MLSISPKVSAELRDLLVEELRNRFIGILIGKDFLQVPLTSEEQRSPEIRIAFPLGRLKRMRNGKLDVVELQFDQYRRPRFVINFGVVPTEGVTLPWKHFRQHEADVSALLEAYRLFKYSIWPCWFETGWLAGRNKSNAVKKLVDTTITLFPEIEAWFNNQIVGKHMRAFGFGSA